MKLCKRILPLILALVLIIVSATGLTACSSTGKTLMKADRAKISVNLYHLFLSRMKGNLCSSASYGSAALKDSFWDTVMDADGTTYNDYYTGIVLENTKTYLAALRLFDERGLKLPKSYEDEIDAEIKRLIDEDADGSKTTFNSMLSAYGANVNILREAYLLEAKIAYLRDDLFGANGSKIAPTLIEEYYQQTYVRFKQVFLYTYELVYESDENGDSIYFLSADDNTVVYDKTQKQKTDENGNAVRDAKGNIIYVNEEGRIAYDTKNGIRHPVIDEKGNTAIRDLNETELRQTIDRAEQIYASALEGEYQLFDRLVEEHSEDEGMTRYKNGYYMTAQTDYEAPAVLEAVLEMKDGECRKINSDYGIHIVMKYPLDEGAYTNSDNGDFFLSSEGGYRFMDDMMNQLYADYLVNYKNDIKIDEKLLATADIKRIGANFYY